MLWRQANFVCDKEVDDICQALKAFLAHLPKIANPIPRETLLLYLAALEQVVSAVLVVERAKEQITIYNVSNALAGDEANYRLIKKFAYTLVMAS